MSEDLEKADGRMLNQKQCPDNLTKITSPIVNDEVLLVAWQMPAGECEF